MRARSLRSIVSLAGGLGLIVSVFAALEFYEASLTQACSVNAFFSCALIANSGKTTTLGVQDWVWGLVGFIAIIVLAALLTQRPKDRRILYGLLTLTSAGVAFSAYLLYVELVEIHGLCPVCLSAYALGVVAWASTLGLVRKAYRRDHPIPEPSPNVS